MNVVHVKPTSRMGEIIGRFGVTSRAVRFYEGRGLITPSRDRLNRRIFDRATTERLSLILALRGAGLGLPEIKDLLASQGADWDLQLAALLTQRRARLVEQLQSVEAALQAFEPTAAPPSERRR